MPNRAVRSPIRSAFKPVIRSPFDYSGGASTSVPPGGFELREDGTFELREDGTFELRE